MNRSLLSFACLLPLFFSCGKPKPSGREFYTILRNDQDSAMNYAFYGTAEDYIQSKNRLIQVRLLPHTEHRINFDIQDPVNFYLDIYSDGYTYSNWATGINTYQVPTGFLKNTYLPHTTQWITNRRRYFLDGNEAETRWRAVDAADALNHSVWGTLNAYERDQVLLLSKSGMYTYIRKKDTGEEQVKQGFFFNESNGCLFKTEANNVAIYNARAPLSIIPALKDTLVFDNGELDVLMVREP